MDGGGFSGVACSRNGRRYSRIDTHQYSTIARVAPEAKQGGKAGCVRLKRLRLCRGRFIPLFFFFDALKLFAGFEADGLARRNVHLLTGAGDCGRCRSCAVSH